LLVKLRAYIAVVALLCVASACSSNPPTSEDTAAPEVPKVQQSEPATPAASQSADAKEVEAYFRLFATNDTDEQGKAVKLAAPKSPAVAYMIHQSATNGAQLDAGNSGDADSLEPIDDGYEICSVDEGDETCTKFTDLKVVAGRLSSFMVNGKPIGPRLSLGQGDEVRAGKLATVEFVSAYKTASAEELIVNLTIRSKSKPIDLNQLYRARYREPGGRQVTATNAYVFDDLDADSHTRTSVIFAKAKPGGVVTVDIVDAKTYADATAKVRI
jgi:hypothetical protein